MGSTTTDANGQYLLEVPCGGQYSVAFSAGDDLVATIADQGLDDEADSDVDPETNTTACFEVLDQNRSVDAGFIEDDSIVVPDDGQDPINECDCQVDLCLPQGVAIDSATLTLEVVNSGGHEVSVHHYDLGFWIGLFEYPCVLDCGYAAEP